MMYTMPKNLLSICVNFALATQHIFRLFRADYERKLKEEVKHRYETEPLSG